MSTGRITRQEILISHLTAVGISPRIHSNNPATKGHVEKIHVATKLCRIGAGSPPILRRRTKRAIKNGITNKKTSVLG